MTPQLVPRREVSSSQAAQALGITQRRLLQLLIAGRIPGARKLDRMRWLVPVGADGVPEVLSAEEGRAKLREVTL